MRFALALATLLLVAACGTDDGGRATDPAASPPSASPPTSPSAGIPPADGRVATRTLATVMDTGSPELCLGPVAESYPPQCRGIPLRGWDWADHPGAFETAGGVRWGQFAVVGTFDGTTMTVTQAMAEAIYDPNVLEVPGPPDELAPTGDAGIAGPKQQEIQRKVEEHPLPGTLSVYATPAAVVVEVVHDDGSLQAGADAAYGPGLVQVRSMLVPVS